MHDSECWGENLNLKNEIFDIFLIAYPKIMKCLSKM